MEEEADQLRTEEAMIAAAKLNVDRIRLTVKDSNISAEEDT